MVIVGMESCLFKDHQEKKRLQLRQTNAAKLVMAKAILNSSFYAGEDEATAKLLALRKILALDTQHL